MGHFCNPFSKRGKNIFQLFLLYFYSDFTRTKPERRQGNMLSALLYCTMKLAATFSLDKATQSSADRINFLPRIIQH
jgi:hypothetical protein